ncbi:MAG: glycoside hydrolase family 13 protein [Lachnospiraceae bacterium]|nr:glycoside hydrolase family 13 protein [Lachnospiraceae bacterium]
MDNFFGFLPDTQYITAMRPVLRRSALYSDTSENFVSPAEPAAYSTVRIRFRAALNNIDAVYLVCKGESHYMLKEDSDELFDYYYCDQQLEDEPFTYYFEVSSGFLRCFYDGRGCVKEPDPAFEFRIVPGFHTPAWAKGAVMYQIFTDRFCNGDPSNDPLTDEYAYLGDHSKKIENWEQNVAPMDVGEFYGGDLQGVLDKLDYLQDLGVEVLYMNPLFVSPSSHKYDIQDYDHIDPHFTKIVKDEGELLKSGDMDNTHATRYICRVTDMENLDASNAFFAHFVEEVHKRGMKIILDGVFNHCGSFNKWLDRECIYENAPGFEKGAHVEEDSPYHDFFRFHNPYEWPYNTTYDGWWGHDTLPKLNYEGSRELFEYVMRIGEKWVSPPYNVDGWRLDVAADLGHSPEYNHYFWKEFRRRVKAANPDAIILAEHYGDVKPWLNGDEWDSIMNYDGFMEPVTWFLTGMEKHSDDFRQDMLGNDGAFFGAMYHADSQMLYPSREVSMNELSNHDHSRFLTRTNHVVGRVANLGPEAAGRGIDKNVMRMAVLIQMTWVGAPTIYYGDEVGLCGFTDPDNRRTYPWGKEDQEMLAFHKAMISLHKTCKELKRGSITKVESKRDLLVYCRFIREAQSIIIVNRADHPMSETINVWECGVNRESAMVRMMLTTPDGYTEEHLTYTVSMGKMKIEIPPRSAMVLRCVRGDFDADRDEEELEEGIWL